MSKYHHRGRSKIAYCSLLYWALICQLIRQEHKLHTCQIPRQDFWIWWCIIFHVRIMVYEEFCRSLQAPTGSGRYGYVATPMVKNLLTLEFQMSITSILDNSNKSPQHRWLKQRNLFSPNFGGQKFRTKVSAGVVPTEGSKR